MDKQLKKKTQSADKTISHIAHLSNNCQLLFDEIQRLESISASSLCNFETACVCVCVCVRVDFTKQIVKITPTLQNTRAFNFVKNWSIEPKIKLDFDNIRTKLYSKFHYNMCILCDVSERKLQNDWNYLRPRGITFSNTARSYQISNLT